MTQHESIFAGTIRKHEWRDNPSRYAASIFERQTEYAPAGSLKFHGFLRGVSHEPQPVHLFRKTGPEAMADAVRLYAPSWESDIDLDGHPLP